MSDFLMPGLIFFDFADTFFIEEAANLNALARCRGVAYHTIQNNIIKVQQ
jgi:hypothetical protein